MLKVLLKKQLAEVFRSYFFDAKKNRMRSKAGVIGMFGLYILIMVGMLGGIFTGLSLSICGPLESAGMGWLYFLLMGGIAIALGAFGSVFSTYSSLYLAKDNDLLLSLPVPVDVIMASRLLNVYVLGTTYAAVVLVPALAVSWIAAGITFSKVVCGLIMFLTVTLVVLILSCILGYGVARLSRRLKNRSFATVILSLLFIGLYYYCYFNAAGSVQKLVLNAVYYGEQIRGSAYLLYLFGRIGQGDLPAAFIYAFAAVLLFALVWIVLSRSFLTIAASGGTSEKVQYKEKAVRQKTVFQALLVKEFGRFTASANFMLNCGLGVLMIPACGILLLVKGKQIFESISLALSSRPGSAAVLVCTMLVTLMSMNDMTVPSVSLEGKNLWIPRSLPAETKTVLRAKLSVQLLLTGIPVLFAAVCAAAVIPAPIVQKVLVVLLSLVCCVFLALCGMFLAVKMPLLSWTDETAVIKRSGSVTIFMFGTWALSCVFAAVYLLAGYRIGVLPYLVIWIVLFTAGSLYLLRWLDTKGCRLFEEL